MYSKPSALLAIALLGTTAPAASQHTLTLNDALSMAQKTSAQIMAQQSVDVAERIARRAQAMPNTGVVLTGSEEPEPGELFPRFTEIGAVAVNVGSSVSRTAALANTRAAVQQSVGNLAATRRNTARLVIDMFFAVAADLQEAQSQTEAVALANRTVSAAESRQRVGAAPVVDVQRAQSALAAAQADLAAAQESLSGDEETLSILIGSADRLSILVPQGPTNLPDVATVSAAALRSSPFVKSSEAAYNLARAAASIARGAAQPGLSLSGGVATSSSGSQRKTSPDANVNLTVPLTTSFNRAEIVSADATADVAAAALEQVERETIQSALRSRTVAAAQLARLPYLQQAFIQAQRVADADLGGYRLGAVNSADVVFAQGQLAAARSALRLGEVRTSLAYAELELEIGELPT